MTLTVEQQASLPGIITAKEKIVDQYLGKGGVTGVGVGFKVKGGITTDQLAIVFFVEKKQDVTGDALLPTSIEGCSADVVEGSFTLFNNEAPNKASTEVVSIEADPVRVDPIIGGVRIQVGDSGGTLGIVATQTAGPVILTCGHVAPETGVSVDQPAPKTIGSNVCATVEATMEQNYSYNGQEYYVDAAIATHNFGARKFKPNYIDAYGEISGTVVAFPGQSVEKQGMRTGKTYGTIKSINTTVTLKNGRILKNVLTINDGGTAFGAPGDSGSIVINTSCNVVGILFGCDDNAVALVTPIAPVLDAMGITI